MSERRWNHRRIERRRGRVPLVAEAAPAGAAAAATEVPPAAAKPVDTKPAAKKPDRVFLPHAKDAIPIRPNSAEMFVLQQLRDEAHRFAVSFHRGQRRRLTLRSALAAIPGIGAARQRLLLRHFGSVEAGARGLGRGSGGGAGHDPPGRRGGVCPLGQAAGGGVAGDAILTPDNDAENQAEELAIDDAFAACRGGRRCPPPAAGGQRSRKFDGLWD